MAVQASACEQRKSVLEVAALDKSDSWKLCLVAIHAWLVSPCSQTPQLMDPASLFEHRISLRNHSYSLRSAARSTKRRKGRRGKRNTFRHNIHEPKHTLVKSTSKDCEVGEKLNIFSCFIYAYPETILIKNQATN